MIDLEIKSWGSPDIELEAMGEQPDADFCFLLELEIGQSGDVRRDVFYIQVATPEGLRSKLTARDGVLSERALLVVASGEPRIVRRAIQHLVDASAATSWTESVLRLQRYFKWEYEDYVQES